MDLSKRKSLMELKLERISIAGQCKLLGISRTSLYYEKRLSLTDANIHIMSAYEKERILCGKGKRIKNYIIVVLTNGRA